MTGAAGCLYCNNSGTPRWNVANNSCAASCLALYFADTVTSFCLPCEATCTTCNGTTATSCLSCPTGRALLTSNHTCATSCPSSMYNNSGMCANCDATCATCSGGLSTNCLSCPSGLVFYSAVMTDDITPRQIFSEIAITCSVFFTGP